MLKRVTYCRTIGWILDNLWHPYTSTLLLIESSGPNMGTVGLELRSSPTGLHHAFCSILDRSLIARSPG
jgi:hypothetical protein